MLTVYLNGEFMPESEAKVSINDRGFLYGDGIFETLRAYDGMPFRIADHIRRFSDSATELKMRMPLSGDELRQTIARLLSENSLKDAYIRIALTRGPHSGDLSFQSDAEPTIVAVARPLKLPSPEKYEKGVSASIVKGIANPPALARYKTSSYLPYLLAREIARLHGSDEALIIDSEGRLLEAAAANVFLVKNGALRTPIQAWGVLPGITRMTVIDVANDMGMDLKAETLGVEELMGADEVFITNSIIEVLPVRSINGKVVGDGGHRLTRRIHEAYSNVVDSCLKIMPGKG